MPDERVNCLIVAEPDDPVGLLTPQFAEFRGARVKRAAELGPYFDALPAQPGSLIAMSAALFARLDSGHKLLLKYVVERGATLYLRGFKSGWTWSVEPFAGGSFHIASEPCDAGYRLTNDPIVPSALQNEIAHCRVSMAAAERFEVTRPLLMARNSNGEERPSIFALSCGAGRVICDLVGAQNFTNEPILARLSDPAKRCADLGALFAVDIARGRELQLPAAFNLVIDDRPASHDYFSTRRLETLLRHLDAKFPGVHVDFAWTPDQTHPNRGYVDTLRAFNAGFVWHGFQHHIDHTTIDDLEGELAAGTALVELLSRRFAVQFQKVMVFPFERADARSFAALAEHAFLAAVELANARPWLDDALPAHLRYSTPAHYHGNGVLPCLRRYAPSMLERGTMLALAALGYPIIVAAHPGDVTLRRFAAARSRGSTQYFDDVLAFAAEKKLRPASLEQIAGEMFALRGSQTDYSTRLLCGYFGQFTLARAHGRFMSTARHFSDTRAFRDDALDNRLDRGCGGDFFDRGHRAA